MDYQKLRTELQLPAYNGLSDQSAVDALNALTRTRERTLIPAYEIIEATAPAEWTALTAAEKQRYQTITGAGDVNVRGANTRAALAAMFGAGTATRTALLALQNETVSRATELGLDTVTALDVSRARGGAW